MSLTEPIGQTEVILLTQIAQQIGVTAPFGQTEVVLLQQIAAKKGATILAQTEVALLQQIVVQYGLDSRLVGQIEVPLLSQWATLVGVAVPAQTEVALLQQILVAIASEDPTPPGFNPETLGDLLLWQQNTNLGEVAQPVVNWINSAAAGPASVSTAGGNVVVNDFLGPKMAFCESAAVSYMESNANLGWSGADFYTAIVLASANVTTEGEANVIYMNAGSFEVFIGNDETIGVIMGGTPYVFTDALYPGSNTIFLLEVWRDDDAIRCAVNGVDSALSFTDSSVEANAPLEIGNVEATAGIILGEILFYNDTISNRASLQSYLMTEWGL